MYGDLPARLWRVNLRRVNRELSGLVMPKGDKNVRNAENGGGKVIPSGALFDAKPRNRFK